MDEVEVMRRVFYSVLCALMIAFFVSYWLGEKKAIWFHRRESWNIFTKRGWFGEKLNFGRPVTKEGYLVSLGMAAAMAVVTAIIFLV